MLDYTLAENLVLQQYFEPRFSKAGFLKKREISAYAKTLVERFDIRTGAGISTQARSMSGGNQQKAIIAREINTNPDLLLAVQPTRGLDVGATHYIRERILASRNKGKAVLLISAELDEVLELSDRIAVMYEGRIVDVRPASQFTERELGLLMTGQGSGV